MLDAKILNIKYWCQNAQKYSQIIVNSKILIKIYKNSENKHYTNTIFKAKKTPEH